MTMIYVRKYVLFFNKDFLGFFFSLVGFILKEEVIFPLELTYSRRSTTNIRKKYFFYKK